MKRILIILSLVVLLISCTEPPKPLRISVFSIWPLSLVAFIAQEKGLFTKYEVQVELVSMSELRDTLQAYRNGQIEGVYTVLPDALTLDSEGIASRVVYATCYSDTGDLIVGHPSLNTLSDLKGKTISFEGFNSFSHYFVIKLLEETGIHEGEFKAADVKTHEVFKALEAGRIDAGHIYGSFSAEAIAKGYKVLGKSGDMRYPIVDTLVFNEKTVRERRADVENIIKALVEVIDFLKTSPEESFEIMAKFATVSKTELETTYQSLKVFSLADNKRLFEREGDLFKGGQEIIDFLYGKGVLVRIPDLNQVIDGQFVKNIGDK